MTETPTIIAVIGGRSTEQGLLTEAEKAGGLIAKRGAVVLTGGLSGVMEAACRGARNEGGLTLGVLPGEDVSTANAYVSVPVATGLGLARNAIIARTATALIAIGGEYGTLSEIAHALQLGKPVAGISTWDIKGVIATENAADAVKAMFEALESKDTGQSK